MPETELSSAQAFELAQEFHLLREKVGKYRFTNWNQLTPEERQNLEDFEWTLDTYSSDFNLKSIILLVESAEVEAAVKGITNATDKMKSAIKNITAIGKVIDILTAAVKLGGAVISGNPIAIAGAINNVVTVVTGNG